MGKFSLKKTFNSVKNHVNNAYNSAHNAVKPFMGSTLGALVGGPVGLYYGTQYDMMKMQNQMQNDQIERQNELNMQMWEMQNQYNSPSAQMQRYKDAGLNPNLIYGSVSNGNASSAPEITASVGGSNALALASIINQASGDASKLLKGVASHMLGNYLDGLDLDLAQKSANIANIKANTKQVLKSVDTQAYKPTSAFGRTVEDAKHYTQDLDNYLAERNIERDIPLSGKEKDNYSRMEYRFIHGYLPKERFYAFLDRQRNIDGVHDRYASYLERKYARW